jgi:hypothetical protein
VVVLGTFTLGTVVLPLDLGVIPRMVTPTAVSVLSLLLPEESPLIPRARGTSECWNVVLV